MPEKKLTLGSALIELRKTLKLTQGELAIKLTIGASSIAHFETGARRPDAEGRVRMIRAALSAERLDLADVFAADLPGVREGLLVPVWKGSKPGSRFVEVNIHVPDEEERMTLQRLPR